MHKKIKAKKREDVKFPEALSTRNFLLIFATRAIVDRR